MKNIQNVVELIRFIYNILCLSNLLLDASSPFIRTKKERRKPDILNASRKKRIAAGSGTSVEDINKLLRQYEQMRKMYKQMNTKGSKTSKAMKRMMGGMGGFGGGMPPGFPM